LYSQIIGSQITQNPQILNITTRLCTPSATSYPLYHYTTRPTSRHHAPLQESNETLQ